MYLGLLSLEAGSAYILFNMFVFSRLNKYITYLLVLETLDWFFNTKI